MTPVVNGFSISARRAAGYDRAFPYLCEELKREGFEILCEFRVDPALERRTGLSWAHLGLPWQDYTVVVVWSPLDAGPALLSDRDGGLLLPLNICVASDGASTAAAVINPFGALMPRDGPVGIRLVIRNLARRIYEVLLRFANEEEPSILHELEVSNAHGL
jgi:uncharacterized protein (DUF302 family)